jgi:hypothetical protein
MKNYIYIFSVLIFLSCENDLNINDTWKDIPIIYSILNSGTQLDSDGSNFSTTIPNSNFNFDGDNESDINYIHFVRVQKSFLGSESAYSYANIHDSVYYDANNLSVWMELEDPNYMGNVSPVKIPLELVSGEGLVDSEIQKDFGIFNYDDHYLYQLPNDSPDATDLCQGDCGNLYKSYKIFVLNQLTGDTAYSETNIVEPLNMTRPRSTGSISVLKLGLDVPISIQIKPSKNAKMYSVSLVFNYMEQSEEDYLFDVDLGNDLPTTGIVYKSIDWTLSDELASEQQVLGLTNSTINKTVYGSQFFEFLTTQISSVSESVPEFYRYPLNTIYQGTHNGVVAGLYHRCVDLNIVAVNSELYTYLNANAPSYGLNQERPQYNNIENGLGHFSSRSILNLSNLRIDQSTMDSISFGQITRNLNFACFNTLGSSGLSVNFGFDCEE